MVVVFFFIDFEKAFGSLEWDFIECTLIFFVLETLDVARCYLWLFTLYINIKIGKIVVKC